MCLYLFLSLYIPIFLYPYICLISHTPSLSLSLFDFSTCISSIALIYPLSFFLYIVHILYITSYVYIYISTSISLSLSRSLHLFQDVHMVGKHELNQKEYDFWRGKFRRMCEPKRDSGKIDIPPELHKQYMQKGTQRDSMFEAFITTNGDKEPTPFMYVYDLCRLTHFQLRA